MADTAGYGELASDLTVDTTAHLASLSGLQAQHALTVEALAQAQEQLTLARGELSAALVETRRGKEHGMEAVRYAATIEHGPGFLAFAGGYAITPASSLEVGEVELPQGARILPDGFAIWPFPKLRSMMTEDGEFVYLVDTMPVGVKMATDLGNGVALICTRHEVPGALWGGAVTAYAFDRAAYVELALA